MPLFFNPFTGNIEFKPAGSGGGGGITGAGLPGQVTFWNTPASVSGNNNLFWDALNFRLGIGSNTPQSLLHTFESSTNIIRGPLLDQYNIGPEGSRLFLRKSRGAIGLPSIINSGDIIGELIFSGYDSTGFLNSAIIRAIATGTILGTRVPSNLIFQTSTNATPSVLTTALTINETQKATFANNVELTSLSVFDSAVPSFKVALDSPVINSLRLAQNFTSLIFSTTTTNITCGNAVMTWNFPGGAASTGLGFRVARVTALTHTTGQAVQISTIGSYTVATGNGVFTLIDLDATINQTGVATGAITGIDISPTLTSISGQFFGLRSSLNLGTPGGGQVWNLFIDGTEKNSIVGLTKFGAITAPIGRVDIAPGNVTNPPLKLSTGVLTTGGAILAGNIEFNTDNYYLTGDTGLTRKVIRDLSYQAITIATALDGRNEFIDCTSGTFTVTLPTAIGFLKQFTIFNSGAGVITMGSVLGQSINGNTADTYTLVQYDCIILRSNGANWYKLN